MTGDKIARRVLLEKGSDTIFLREMIGFAAERLMALGTSSVASIAKTSALAIATATGKRGPALSSCALPSRTSDDPIVSLPALAA